MLGTNYGWTCPRCGNVWAPNYPGPCTCHEQTGSGVTTTGVGTGDPPYIPPPNTCEAPTQEEE